MGECWGSENDQNGAPSRTLLETIKTIRMLLTADGRSLAQGALAWCLGQSDTTVPLPGCRTPRQAKDNFGTLSMEPLPEEILKELKAVVQKDAEA
jgi:aryl-alcohol dehydrogenase-like predicted oxidoreductase